jgi:hypothetical protein
MRVEGDRKEFNLEAQWRLLITHAVRSRDLHAKENEESQGWKESNSLEVPLTVAELETL